MPSKMVHIGEKRPNSEPKLCAALKTGVVDVGGDQGGGGGAWRTPCIKTRYRFPVHHAMY